VADVALRLIDDSDLDALFNQMRDPESVWMAAFTTKDPDDRDAFDAHMSRLRTSPDVTVRAVIFDGRLVGSIGSFVFAGQTEVTYWIDRSASGSSTPRTPTLGGGMPRSRRPSCVSTRACPVDHLTGSRSQILIDATSTVP
jgi:Acetyltransferase (GNAT) domain